MSTTTQAPRKLALYGVIVSTTILAIALLAMAFTTGLTEAQNADNTYDNPRPCGPGPNTDVAFQPEPHEVTTGHFALFDAYWEWTKDASKKDVKKNKGIMHTNDCPPKMVTTREDDGFGNVTVTVTRNVSNIDLGEAIMHVKNVRQVPVVATNAEANNAKLSLEEYPAVREALGLGEDDPVPAGTKVWWLRLDDPDTTGKDESSDLSIGFSTALFDRKYWLTRAEGAPMRYMLETARYRNTNPADAPHFFAYEAPLENDGTQGEPVLDSTNLDVGLHDMTLDPGEYRALQWIFTKEGTYELSAHLQGFVRRDNPHPSGHPDYDANWKRISPKEDETSEVKDYVFQVGDKLDETEPPMFGVNRSVHEDASAGAHVGEPIRVFNVEDPLADLHYNLSGEGHDHFRVDDRTHPFAAQIVVAPGVDLEFDSKSSYLLVLGVTDGKDHEGNDDNSIDHKIAVEIDLIQDPHAYLIASKHTPAVGESVSLRTNLWNMPDGITSVTDNHLSYTIWEAKRSGVVTGAVFPAIDPNSFEGTATISQNAAGHVQVHSHSHVHPQRGHAYSPRRPGNHNLAQPVEPGYPGHPLTIAVRGCLMPVSEPTPPAL